MPELIEIIGSSTHDGTAVPVIAEAAGSLGYTILYSNASVVGSRLFFCMVVEVGSTHAAIAEFEAVTDVSSMRASVRPFEGDLTPGPLSGNPRWEVWASAPEDRPGLLAQLARRLYAGGAYLVEVATRVFPRPGHPREAVIHVHFVPGPECDLDMLVMDLRDWAPEGLTLRPIDGELVRKLSVPWADPEDPV